MKPIKIVDGKDVILKSTTTTSVDIHLQEYNQQVQIIFPCGIIAIVEADGTLSVWDHTDTGLYTTNILHDIADNQCGF